MDKTHGDYVCRKHRGIQLLNYLTVDVDVCVCVCVTIATFI